MTSQSGKRVRSRTGIRLLISGVAAGTTVLAGAPAALAFLLTGSVNPSGWGWDNLSARLSACTSTAGVSGVLGCRRSVQATYVSEGMPEEHRKGRRIIVYVPVAEPPAAALPHRPHASPASTNTLRTARTPAAEPSRAQPPHPAPSPDRHDHGHEHDTEGDGAHD
jgi:hypothetical protein